MSNSCYAVSFPRPPASGGKAGIQTGSRIPPEAGRQVRDDVRYLDALRRTCHPEAISRRIHGFFVSLRMT